MLGEWLAPQSLVDFAARYLGRQPLARAATADLDILVVQGGREWRRAPPRSLEGLRQLFAQRLGVVVRRAEFHDPGLATLSERFARDLPGDVHVQLFATPARTHGFGWHYDAEEVFIIQTAGEKDYYFRRNTIDPHPRRDVQPDFARVREERTPILTTRLVAGDWLYLPRGWWHVAKARADSLSISLGSRPEPQLPRRGSVSDAGA
jgi:ribosomal protein L16 Arg81 hydroxylase